MPVSALNRYFDIFTVCKYWFVLRNKGMCTYLTHKLVTYLYVNKLFEIDGYDK